MILTAVRVTGGAQCLPRFNMRFTDVIWKAIHGPTCDRAYLYSPYLLSSKDTSPHAILYSSRMYAHSPIHTYSQYPRTHTQTHAHSSPSLIQNTGILANTETNIYVYILSPTHLIAQKHLHLLTAHPHSPLTPTPPSPLTTPPSPLTTLPSPLTTPPSSYHPFTDSPPTQRILPNQPSGAVGKVS